MQLNCFPPYPPCSEFAPTADCGGRKIAWDVSEEEHTQKISLESAALGTVWAKQALKCIFFKKGNKSKVTRRVDVLITRDIIVLRLFLGIMVRSRFWFSRTHNHAKIILWPSPHFEVSDKKWVCEDGTSVRKPRFPSAGESLHGGQ